MSLYNRKKISGILYVVIAYVLAVLLVGNYFAFSYAGLVSQVLGQQTFRTEEVSDGEAFDSNYYKGSYTSLTQLVDDQTAYAHQVQAEGSVLLQNAGLPVAKGGTVTLLGVGSTNTFFYAGGSGSGATNASRAKEIDAGFTAAGYAVNPTALSYFAGQIADPMPDELPSDVRASFAQYHDLGVVFIGRAGGESRDLLLTDLQLTEQEKGLIDLAIAEFDRAVVLLNTMNPMELGYLEGKDISILWIGGPGEVMIGAIPEVLNGTRYPSGKLVDTYAYDVTSAPAMANFGDLNMLGTPEDARADKYYNYAEGIYVGYRYYETRYADAVMGQGNAGSYDYDATVQYPFGYGLGYTTFAYSGFSMAEHADSFTFSVTVSNTGALPGKEAVQLYMQSPYTDYDRENGVEKSAVELVGFAKTPELQPGASATVDIEVEKASMRAYDANGARTYIVDAGDYYFAAGEDAHAALNHILTAQGYPVGGDAALTGVYHQDAFDDETYSYGADGVKITNQFDDAALTYFDPSAKYLTRSDWMGTMPTPAGDMTATAEMLALINPEAQMDPDAVMPITGQDNGIQLASLLYWKDADTPAVLDFDDELWDQLLDEMTPQDMMDLVAIGGYGTLSIPSPVNKPGTVDADGPSGFGGIIMGGSNTFGYPVEILLASTWNIELAQEMGSFIGEDGLISGRTGWYATAVNTHRTARSGRNFEYYSEDPVLSGKMSAAVTAAAQEKGVVAYVKHYAVNDQETNRSSANTFATEQAIREIYLRPFEYSVTDGKAMGIMNSMNRIGMNWAGSHYGLLTAVLRNEWGFKGTVITDAATSQSPKMEPTRALLAGTDLFLCTNKGVFEIPDFASDPTVMTALRQAAHRIMYTYVQSNAMNGLSAATRLVQVTPPWQTALIVADVIVSLAAVGGIVFLTRWMKKGKKERA